MKQVFKIKSIEYNMGTQHLSAFDIGNDFITEDHPKERVYDFIRGILGKENIYRFTDQDDPIELGMDAAKRA